MGSTTYAYNPSTKKYQAVKTPSKSQQKKEISSRSKSSGSSSSKPSSSPSPSSPSQIGGLIGADPSTVAKLEAEGKLIKGEVGKQSSGYSSKQQQELAAATQREQYKTLKLASEGKAEQERIDVYNKQKQDQAEKDYHAQLLKVAEQMKARDKLEATQRNVFGKEESFYDKFSRRWEDKLSIYGKPSHIQQQYSQYTSPYKKQQPVLIDKPQKSKIIKLAESYVKYIPPELALALHEKGKSFLSKTQKDPIGRIIFMDPEVAHGTVMGVPTVWRDVFWKPIMVGKVKPALKGQIEKYGLFDTSDMEASRKASKEKAKYWAGKVVELQQKEGVKARIGEYGAKYFGFMEGTVSPIVQGINIGGAKYIRESPEEVAFTVVTGALVGGAKAGYGLVSTGVKASTKAVWLGRGLKGLYGASVGYGFVKAEDKSEYVGKEAVKLGSFLGGLKLGQRGVTSFFNSRFGQFQEFVGSPERYSETVDKTTKTVIKVQEGKLIKGYRIGGAAKGKGLGLRFGVKEYEATLTGISGAKDTSFLTHYKLDIGKGKLATGKFIESGKMGKEYGSSILGGKVKAGKKMYDVEAIRGFKIKQDIAKKPFLEFIKGKVTTSFYSGTYQSKALTLVKKYSPTSSKKLQVPDYKLDFSKSFLKPTKEGFGGIEVGNLVISKTTPYTSSFVLKGKTIPVTFKDKTLVTTFARGKSFETNIPLKETRVDLFGGDLKYKPTINLFKSKTGTLSSGQQIKVPPPSISGTQISIPDTTQDIVRLTSMAMPTSPTVPMPTFLVPQISSFGGFGSSETAIRQDKINVLTSSQRIDSITSQRFKPIQGIKQTQTNILKNAIAQIPDTKQGLMLGSITGTKTGQKQIQETAIALDVAQEQVTVRPSITINVPTPPPPTPIIIPQIWFPGLSVTKSRRRTRPTKTRIRVSRYTPTLGGAYLSKRKTRPSITGLTVFGTPTKKTKKTKKKGKPITKPRISSLSRKTFTGFEIRPIMT